MDDARTPLAGRAGANPAGGAQLVLRGAGRGHPLPSAHSPAAVHGLLWRGALSCAPGRRVDGGRLAYRHLEQPPRLSAHAAVLTARRRACRRPGSTAPAPPSATSAGLGWS